MESPPSRLAVAAKAAGLHSLDEWVDVEKKSSVEAAQVASRFFSVSRVGASRTGIPCVVAFDGYSASSRLSWNMKQMCST